MADKLMDVFFHTSIAINNLANLLEVNGLCPSLPDELKSRRMLVAAVTIFALIPLCLKRRFSLLRVSSIAGLVCTLSPGRVFCKFIVSSVTWGKALTIVMGGWGCVSSRH